MTKPNLQTARPHDGVQPDEAEIQTAKEVLAALAAAVKNYSLYPSNHSISQRSVRNFRARITRFFEAYACEFKLHIAKSGLVYKDIPIHSPSNDSDAIVAPFFRDGILWIALFPGIEPNELSRFLDIVCDHRILKDEAGSDLVTALWKANLPHVRHEAIDSFWEARPVFDFNDFSIGNESGVQTVANQGIAETPAASDYWLSKSKTPSEGEHQFFALTATENELLAKLISKNDIKDETEDVIDILLIILADQKNENDFIYILDLLQEEFKLTLAEANFRLSYYILKGIKNLNTDSPGIFPLRQKLINDFFFKISFDEILEALEPGLLK